MNPKLVVSVLGVFVALNVSLCAQTSLVSHTDDWRYRKGTSANGAPQSLWKTVEDSALDATWLTGKGGFGYADNTAETAQCQTLLSDMKNNYTSVCIRRQFVLTNTPPDDQHLYLRMDFDDGFVAWLDGQVLTNRNSGTTTDPAYNASASSDHESSLGNSSPQPADVYDLGMATNWLSTGTHTLAVQGLNGGSGSSDFVLISDLYLDTPPAPVVITWHASNSPIVINTNVTIAANATLVIEPGTTVQYGAGVRVIANGRVVAAGTADQRIRFTRAGASDWSGFSFNGNHQSNVFAHVDFEYASGTGNGGSAVIYINDSQVTFERDTFLNCYGHKYMDVWYPQVILRNSVFDDVGPSYMFTIENLKPDGWFIVDGNLFGTDTGDSDIFHLNHISVKNGPKAVLVNNVFCGAGDDHIDDNESDSHIEGNLFLNFTTNHPPRSASCAVTTGEGSGNGHNLTTQHLTVVRNVFWGCDYGIINKDGSYVQIYNCVFVNNRGGIIFDEPWRTDSSGPGRGCYIESSIFWNNWPDNGVDEGIFAYLTNSAAYRSTAYYHGATQVTVNNSILPAQYHYLGNGNIEGDPLFILPASNISLSATNPAFAKGFDGFDANTFLLTNNLVPDLRLQPGSPALGAGYNGADMGIYASTNATLSGEPASPTSRTQATLRVAGLDIAGYKYRLIGPGFTNDWSTERQALKYVPKITLTGAMATATVTNHGYADGDLVQVIGADSLCPYYNGVFTVSNVTASTFSYAVQRGTNAAMDEPLLTYDEKQTDIWCRKIEPIVLDNLVDGAYRVEAVRKNSMDVWQSTNTPTVSKSWTVMTRPLQMEPPHVTPEAVNLRFYAVAGQAYQIQATDTFNPPQWRTVIEVPAPSENGSLSYSLTPAPEGNRYFRLVAPGRP